MSWLNPYNWVPSKKEEKKEEKKGIEETSTEETEPEEETETETDNESLKSLKSITPMMKKKPLRERITPEEETEEETKKPKLLSDEDFEEGFKEQDEETETSPTETPTEEAPETTETEEKKIVPKKTETKIINKIADSVESFIKHDKPLIDTINDLRECLTVLPEDRKYEIVEYVARELANATDAEGNKLFKDETEAKQFLHTISTKTPNIRYKLPIEIQKEIKEKTPKILTSLTQRNIRSIGAANKNIYQY